MQIYPTFDDVKAAARRLEGHALRTPVMTSSTANKLLDAQIFFKCENFQRMGAFKFRGAFNAMSMLTQAQRQAGVVCFSSGNHAQAVALSGKLLGIATAILMPIDAPPLKIEATREYCGGGGQVILFDRFKDDREALARKLATERGMTLIPPYDHVDVIAGSGTAAMELFEDVNNMGCQLDFLFVCLGGGGLLSGSALSARALAPKCKVYGVEPEAGNDVQQSFAKGEIVKIATPKTIADGAQTQSAGNITFPLIQRHVDGIVTATDAQLVEGMKFFAERMKMLVEPTGALSFAAARHAGLPIAGKRVGVIVSGGNVDLQRFAQLVKN